MKCAICNEETIGADPVKWGPEFAHKTCVTAFYAGVDVERERCVAVCEDVARRQAYWHAKSAAGECADFIRSGG